MTIQVSGIRGIAWGRMSSLISQEFQGAIRMKMSALAIVLALVAVVPVAAAPQAQPGASASQAPVIKDPAEYNAYMAAIQEKDPTAEISALESFLVQFPNSVVKVDALETLMGAYQKTGNAAKVGETANRLLTIAPDNVRALVVLAYTERAAQKWPDALQHATHGLDALPKLAKPDGVQDADFEKQKAQMGNLLNSVAGFSALQMKNLPDAQKYLRAAVVGDPNNLENVYPLALAYLTATPPDYVNGLFFIARAADLASGAGQAQIQAYGKSVYTKYHGSDQGWTDVLAAAKTASEPPAGFSIAQYVPPTPAQQCAELMKTKEPKDLSFAEWELCLSAGAPEDVDKVWQAIKGKTLQMEGAVIQASPDELQIAGSDDDIDQKRADIILKPTGTIPPRLMPKEGATLDFEGTPDSYTPSPFVMTMLKGALLTKAAPAHKPPVHHKAPTN
jgi:tetratricopeptide (TPR) repeat protein